jgi:hypothetical protein
MKTLRLPHSETHYLCIFETGFNEGGRQNRQQGWLEQRLIGEFDTVYECRGRFC